MEWSVRFKEPMGERLALWKQFIRNRDFDYYYCRVKFPRISGQRVFGYDLLVEVGELAEKFWKSLGEF